MNVQQGNRQHNSFFLIERLARRIMDQYGRDHRWKEDDMTYLATHNRAQDMDDRTLFRYCDPLLTRDEVNMARVASGRQLACEACYCGYEGEHECDIDHSAGIGLRDIMVHLICEAVCEEIERARWDYFDVAA